MNTRWKREFIPLEAGDETEEIWTSMD